MLDMGFINDIKKVLEKLPRQRQSLFFSATLPKNIIQLSETILRNPKKVSVHEISTTADTIHQFIYYTNKNNKKDLLLHILKNEEIDQLLVFSRTKHGSDRIVRNLKKKKINALAIHGDKSQNQRQNALKAFKNNQLKVFFQLIIFMIIFSFTYNNSIFAQGYGSEPQNQLAQAQDKKEESEEDEDDEDC